MKTKLLMAFVIFLMFVGIGHASVLLSQDSRIYNNYYEQFYYFDFQPQQTDREFVWHVLNFEIPIYDGIDKVIINAGYTNEQYVCTYSPSVVCTVESSNNNLTEIILTEDDLAYSLPKKYFIAELTKPLNLSAEVSAEATSSIRVITYYKEGYATKAYSPVRVESYMATDGTDVCSIIQEANNAQLEFNGGTIFRYAVNIITMNIELIKTMFWLFKIMIFIVALGALFYLFLVIVKLIKGGRP